MENPTILISHEPRHNWFLRRILKYPIITLTIGFLAFYQLTFVLIAYFADRESFLELFDLNIWFWLIATPIIYLLQWLIVIWVASRFTKESLKQKFLKHPLVSIVLFILFVINLPYRISDYGSGIVGIFETVVYYAFVSFLWWLLICWISNKLLRKQRFQWLWYKKIIDNIFDLMPAIYKFILGTIIALALFFLMFMLMKYVFRYSGQDLEVLFS